MLISSYLIFLFLLHPTIQLFCSVFLGIPFQTLFSTVSIFAIRVASLVLSIDSKWLKHCNIVVFTTSATVDSLNCLYISYFFLFLPSFLCLFFSIFLLENHWFPYFYLLMFFVVNSPCFPAVQGSGIYC